MATKQIKPSWTVAQKAWIAAYVAAHGAITMTAEGHPISIGADGTISVQDRSVTVTEFMLVAISTEITTAITASAPGWVGGWIARGMT